MSKLSLHSEPLQPAWLDAYGHLNEAYYLVPFSNASWALQDHLGIGVEHFEATGGALYTVESHLRYLREVRAPAVFEIDSLVLECDAKRLRFAHVMKVDGTERATFECLGVWFDSRAGRTAPFPDDARRAIEAARVRDWPEWVGRGIALTRRA